MKNVLRILLMMGISNALFAQDIINTCISDGIEIVSQEQIDSFSTAYPGCNTILGNVKISGNDIQSLQGLNQIKTIRGNLEISDNTQLQRLAGIERLCLEQKPDVVLVYGDTNSTLAGALAASKLNDYF